MELSSTAVIFAAVIAICALILWINNLLSLDRSEEDYFRRRNDCLFSLAAGIAAILMVVLAVGY